MKLAVLLLAFVSALAAQSQERFSTTIGINVSCDDADLKNRIISSFNGEIRRLGDVAIVEQKERPFYTLEIIGIETRSKGGTDLGYVMSVLIHRQIDGYLRGLSNSIKQKPTGEDGTTWGLAIVGLMMYGTEIVDNRLLTGTPENLPDAVRGLIADFDVKTLEQNRRTWRDAHRPQSQ